MSDNQNQQQRIQDHYEDPYHRGRCERTTHFAEARNAACPHGSGDVVAIELRVVDDEIEEVWFDGEGCELSQAIASMLAEFAETKKTRDVAQLDLPTAMQLLQLKISKPEQHCCQASLSALQQALKIPYDEDVHGPTFSGPDLGDEC